jgi:hypothetical protein
MMSIMDSMTDQGKAIAHNNINICSCPW